MRLIPPLILLFSLACTSGPEPGGALPAALVRVATVQAGTLIEPWSTLGEVQALDRARMAAGAAGPVARVLVREGDRVEAGALLLELDTAVVRAEHQRARAAADEADAAHRRLKDALDRRNNVTDSILAAEELSTARHAVAEAAARLAGQEAEARRTWALVERHRLHAPFAGVVTTRTVDPGDWVRAGDAVLTVMSTEDLEVRAQVPPALARAMSPGQSVQLGVDSGTVVAVVPALDADSRAQLVRIAPTVPHQLQPGQPVRVTVDHQWTDQGVKVPRDAIISDPESASVVEVVDGKAVPVPVELLVSTATEVLVRADALQVGDQVIVRGNERVRPGQDVRIEADGDTP